MAASGFVMRGKLNRCVPLCQPSWAWAAGRHSKLLLCAYALCGDVKYVSGNGARAIVLASLHTGTYSCSLTVAAPLATFAAPHCMVILARLTAGSDIWASARNPYVIMPGLSQRLLQNLQDGAFLANRHGSDALPRGSFTTLTD